MLAAADADLIITFSYDNIPEPMPANHQHRILFDDPMMMVLPAGHPLATAPAVSLGQVAHETWIAGCPKCRRHLTTSAANQGFHPDIHHSTDDYVVTQTLVAAGMGVALLPALAIAAATDLRIRTVPLQQHPPRRIRLANRADIPASPATRVLITTLDEIAANRP
jgi:DNA-binding transcriptional LysR family regulator